MNRIRILLFAKLLMGLSLLATKSQAQNTLTFQEAWGLRSTDGSISIPDMAVDSEGNMVVVGGFRDSIDIKLDPNSSEWLVSGGASDAFIAKYTANGTLLWGFRIGTEYNHDQAFFGVAIDPQDNILVAGRYFHTALDLDPTDSTLFLEDAHHQHPLLVAKYSPNGQALWGVNLGNGYSNSERGFEVASDGSVHIIKFTGGHYPISEYHVIDSAGNITHQQTLVVGTGSSGASSLAIDSEDNVVITGHYINGAVPLLPEEITGTRLFLLKFAPDHSLLWAKTMAEAPTNFWNFTYCNVATAKDNAIYLASANLSGLFTLYKLTPQGELTQQNTFPFTLNHMLPHMVVDQQGALIVAGIHLSNRTFDINPGPKEEMVFTPANSMGIWKINTFGAIEWYKNIPHTSTYQRSKLHLKPDGNITAMFSEGSGGFDPSLGEDPHLSSTHYETTLVNYMVPLKPNFPTLISQNESAYTMGQHPIGLCEQTEVGSTFWLPIVAQDSLPEDVVGLDFCIQYDPAWVKPTTGIKSIRLGETITQTSPNMAFFSEVDEANHTLHLSIYMGNGNTAGCATPNCAIEGSGTLAFVEFQTVDTLSGREVLAYPCGVLEGKSTQAVPQPMGIALHPYALSLEGTLKHWKNDSLLAYNAAAPTGQLPTTIWPTNAGGQPVEAGSLPDDQGRFELRSQHPAFTVTRDIPETWGDSLCGDAIGDFVNGQDILYVRNCITYREGYDFSPFQLLAMDVNMDGRVAANDASLIMHRFLGVRCEFPQQWNYLQGGNSAPVAPSHDWLFVDDLTAASHPSWHPSATWPKDDGVGYSTARVPHLPHPLSTDPSADLCGERTIYGILLGDADGNWGPEAAMGHVRMAQHGTANARLLIDTRAAALTLPDGSGAADGFVYVPVQVMGLEGNLTAVDLSLPNGQSGGRVAEVVQTSYFNEAYDYGVSPEHLGFRLTSWAATRYGAPAPTEAVMYLKLPNVPGKPLIDAATAKAWVNGERVAIEGLETLWDMPENTLNAYPNPSTGEVMLYTEAMELEKGLITIADLSGRIVQQANVSLLRGQTSVDLTGLPTGSYFITLTGEDGNRYHTRVIVSD